MIRDMLAVAGDILAGLLLPLGAALALIAATVAVFVRATDAPDHVADASKMVEPAPVYWQQGEPFNAESVVAEPTGVVR